MKTLPRESPAALTPKTIYAELDRHIIGQDKAKRTVAIAAYNHLKRLNSLNNKDSHPLLKKSNILLLGPTGSGKTHIARILAQILHLPFVVVDATEYTEAGYYGKDVEVMVAELLHKSNMDISATQRGIIFIDEIDKIARASHSARTGSAGRDISGEGVQQALLKMLEGREIFVPIHMTQQWNKQEFVSINTSNILFICAGTFTDLYLYGGKRDMGFESKLRETKPQKKKTGQKRRKLNVKDLHEFGMLDELLGRLPVMVQLHELDKGDLLRVLTEPPDSLIKEYKHLMAIDGINLEFTHGSMETMVEFAMQRGLGARGLRSILEEVMHDFLFSAPDYEGKKITIDESLVKEKLEHLTGDT